MLQLDSLFAFIPLIRVFINCNVYLFKYGTFDFTVNNLLTVQQLMRYVALVPLMKYFAIRFDIFFLMS